ncbi:hypothetical protein EDWATA_03685 [Edwardsiella tarda ATCC 23685]|uniref:Lipoprotein n=1 Tax=Edwardsiella tarda ATCC 23685 TaxID=500638 RepID=D4FA67_EDWTA|nr:hypothetical protein EDWATA_03685 [Edwardsiella tarda ATCC 23685]
MDKKIWRILKSCQKKANVFFAAFLSCRAFTSHRSRNEWPFL